MGMTCTQLEPLLSAHESPPHRIANPDGRSPVVLTCDHASCAVPASLGNLGLEPCEIQRHIGWDPGAARIATLLAERFDAPAILSGFSRLVIDCNRSLGSETSIPKISDGIRIPGNLNLTEEEAIRRAEELFLPYHGAIAEALDRVRARGDVPVFVAIHSFTRRLRNGFARPWHYGVLWDRDPRVAQRLVAALRRHPDLVVGDNEPYSGQDHFDFSQDHHAGSRGLASALVEIRQDLIRDEDGLERHVEILGDALAEVLAEPDLYIKVDE